MAFLPEGQGHTASLKEIFTERVPCSNYETVGVSNLFLIAKDVCVVCGESGYRRETKIRRDVNASGIPPSYQNFEVRPIMRSD